MTGAARPRGPGWARALLARVLPRRDAEQLVLEMDDLYARRVARHGAARAHLWYLRQLVRFALVWAGAGLAAAARALTGLLQWFGRDVRHGLVSLARRPGYAAATVITLGVGVGGVAAIYSVANWVLLRRVPGVAANDRLVTMQLELRSGGSFAFPMSDPDLRDLKEGIVALERLEASAAAPVHVQLGDGPPRRMTAEVVTDGYFDLLGLRLALGRAPAGESGKVLVSHRLWRDAWAGQPGVLGSELRINGHAYQVVGVAAPGFHGAELPGEADACGGGDRADAGRGTRRLGARSGAAPGSRQPKRYAPIGIVASQQPRDIVDAEAVA